MFKNPVIVPIILQFLGVVVLIAEFLIPSAGLLSIVSVGLFGYSLFLVFTDVSTNAGIVFLGADLLVIPVLVIVGLKLLAQSPLALRRTLSSQEGVTSQSAGLAALIGKEGDAISLLRPAGIAEIDGKRYDVVSKGDFIEKGARVVVDAVTGNQIVVRKREQ
jgi:membrane-bound serine protease (ClpP class)